MSKQVENAFAQLLTSARESAGVSRSKLASLVGLNASYVHRLETGNRRPSRETIVAMADALAINEDTLNRWLLAAGHSPMPLLHLMRASVRTRGSWRQPQSSSAGLRGKDATRWVGWLETMGLQELMVTRLIRGMEKVGTLDRQWVMNLVSETLSRAAETLEAPVHTAVIPAAGGYHKLIAHHVMQRLLLRAIGEAAEGGVRDVVLVLAPEMIDYLYTPLKESLNLAVAPAVNLYYSVQARPDGLGDAVLLAEEHVGQQPFAVLLPDDVLGTHASRPSGISDLGVMMNAFTKLNRANLLAATEVPRQRMPKYGIVEVAADVPNSNTLPIHRLIEKPDLTHSIYRSPRTLSIVGRYLLQPEIFEVLRQLKNEGTGPLELTTALDMLRVAGQEVFALRLRCTRQDIGDVFGQATELIETSNKGSTKIGGRRIKAPG